MNIHSCKLSLISFITCLLLIQCSSLDDSGKQPVDPSLGQDRPMEPWVFRSVLDKQPRMLTLALDKELYVAYSTQHSSLYKAWKGDVDLDGAVYTTYHGPQPTSVGNDYFINQFKQPWKLTKAGSPVTSSCQYKGHKFHEGEVILMHELSYNDQKISIEEQPSYRKTGAGISVFDRTFSVKDLPEGMAIHFMTNYASLMGGQKGLQTNGTWHHSKDTGSELIRSHFSDLNARFTYSYK